MNRFWNLLKYELMICHRSYHIIRHVAYVMLFSNIIFSLIISSEDISDQMKMLLIIFGAVMATITLPSYLIKNEIQDGSLENLFVKFRPSIILLAKYCGIVMSVGIGIGITLPVIIVFYSLTFHKICYMTVVMILLIIQLLSIVLLGNIIHAYFRHNTNIILSIIMPIIIPSIIFATLALNSLKIDFILIILGIDMILIPIILMFSNYLLSHIYEF